MTNPTKWLPSFDEAKAESLDIMTQRSLRACVHGTPTHGRALAQNLLSAFNAYVRGNYLAFLVTLVGCTGLVALGGWAAWLGAAAAVATVSRGLLWAWERTIALHVVACVRLDRRDGPLQGIPYTEGELVALDREITLADEERSAES